MREVLGLHTDGEQPVIPPVLTAERMLSFLDPQLQGNSQEALEVERRNIFY